MALDTRVVEKPEELARWQGAWRDLLGRSASDQPTRSPLWLGAWWRIFGPLDGRKLRITLVLDGERLVGLAPLIARRKWHYRAIPFRRLEFLGTGEPEADEICSDHLGVVAERGREPAVAEAIVNGLDRDALGPWDELVLSAMDADDPVLVPLARALEKAGLDTKTEALAGCPYIALPTSFEEYMASLRSEKRYLVKRSLRDFERWAGGHAELREVRTRSELVQGKRILEALHAERWKAEGQRGVFASLRFRAFHDDVMAELLDTGALDLFWLEVHGRPIAAAYNIVWNGKLHFYQSGRTLDVPKGIRPGTVLHAYAIRRAIDAGLEEYDFLAGTSRYKLEFATDVRPLTSLRAVRSRLRESARRTAQLGLASVKRLRG
jgi:CelD/BcsL family acetyltransferase involved in cellulose biosynthesis